MEDKVFLDEAGLGEVGKVISKFYASKDDIKDLDGLKDFVDAHNEIKLHYITNEEYQKMYDEGKMPSLSDIHDPISIVGIEQTADAEYEWSDTPLGSLYVMGLNVERLLGGSSQKYLLFNITPNHKITSDRIDNVDFNAIPLKDKDIRLQLAFGERDLCFYWRFIINGDVNSEWKNIQDPYSGQRIDNLTKQMQDKVDKSELPTKLSQLEEDETHRTVTDTEKNKWNLATNVVDNLESDDSTKPLSAKQGKILFQYANEGKNQIANALIGKGVENVSKDSSFSDLAKGVNGVKTGYGVGDIIESKNVEKIVDKKELKTLFNIGLSKSEEQTKRVLGGKDGSCYISTLRVQNSSVRKINANGESEWSVRFSELIPHYEAIDIHIGANGNLYCTCIDSSQMPSIQCYLVELSPLNNIVSRGDLPYDSNRIVNIDHNNCLYLQTPQTLIKTNSKGEKVWEVDLKGYTAVNNVTNDESMVFTVAAKQSEDKQYALFIINQQGSIISKKYLSGLLNYSTISTDVGDNFYYQENNTIYKITQMGEIMSSIVIESQGQALVDQFGYIYFINNEGRINKINQQTEVVWELSDLKFDSLWLVSNGCIYATSGNTLIAIQDKMEKISYKVLR